MDVGGAPRSVDPYQVFASHPCNLESLRLESLSFSLSLSLSPWGGNPSPAQRTRVPLHQKLRPTPGHLGISMLLSEWTKKGSFTVWEFHPDYQGVLLHVEGREDGSRRPESLQGVS